MPTTKQLAEEAAQVADIEERQAAEAEATAEREKAEARAARDAAKAAAAVAARDSDEDSEARKDKEARVKVAKLKEPAKEPSDRKFYRVTLGYPLYHPYQDKTVPAANGSPAAELSLDGWVQTQLDAGLIHEVASADVN